MPPGDPRLMVSLLTGESQISFMRFLPGQPVAALTVGSEGNWPIRAAGVLRVHLSLVFNGQQLFVAAQSPTGPVSINGTPIDGRWWSLSAPAELRFGQACLRVTYETPSTAPGLMHRGPPSLDLEGHGGGMPTKLDAAAQWLLQHPDQPPPEREKLTLLYDPAVHAQRPVARSDAPAPAARAPDPAARAAPPAVAERPAQAAPDKAPSGPQSAGEPPMVSTLRRPIRPGEPPDLIRAIGGSSPPAVLGAVPPPRPGLSVPLPGESGGATIAVDPSVWVDRASKQNVPPANVIRTPAPPPWAGNPIPPRPSEVPDDALPAGLPRKNPGGALVAAWRSASLVKKITFFLLPMAIVAVLLPEPAPPPGPDASARAVPSSSGAASGSPRTATSVVTGSVAMTSAADAGLAARVGANPSPSAASQSSKEIPEPKTTAIAGSASSDRAAPHAVSGDATERAAIDAAFDGRWLAAVRLYESLAASHPDQPAFREAARILRETKSLAPQ